MSDSAPESSSNARSTESGPKGLTFADIDQGPPKPIAAQSGKSETEHAAPNDERAQYLPMFARPERNSEEPYVAPKVGTVFAGSSTVARWPHLEQDFLGEHAINKGVGGTMLLDVDKNLDDLIVKYHPDKVVLYSGTNDIAAGHDAATVERDLEKTEKDLHAKLPNVELYFVGPSEAPSREDLAPVYVEANKMAENYLEHQPHCHYINIRPIMHDAQGRLKTEDFGDDNLHMNEKGYEEDWKPVIKKALHEDDPTP